MLNLTNNDTFDTIAKRINKRVNSYTPTKSNIVRTNNTLFDDELLNNTIMNIHKKVENHMRKKRKTVSAS